MHSELLLNMKLQNFVIYIIFYGYFSRLKQMLVTFSVTHESVLQQLKESLQM